MHDQSPSQRTRDRRARRTIISLTAAAVSCLAIAAPAGASSIVYTKAGNIWLSSPDGALQRQVTTGGGYSSPSQADDGNIVALHNGLFVHLDRHGNALGAPIDGLSGVSGGTQAIGPMDPRVSPDDKTIAYDIGVISSQWDWTCNCTMQTTEYQVMYTAVDQFTAPSVNGIVRDYATPSWIDNQTTLLDATGIGIDQFATYALGGGGDTDPTHFTQWFSDYSSPRMAKAQMTRAQDKLVTLAGNAAENIGIYSIDSPFPATPTLRCVINEPNPGTTYDDPTWSPDGSQLAFANPNGVYVTAVGNISSGDCSSISPALVLPGAAEPFWGPADVASTDGIQAGATPPPSTSPAGRPPSGQPHTTPSHKKPVRRCVRIVRHHHRITRCSSPPRHHRRHAKHGR